MTLFIVRDVSRKTTREVVPNYFDGNTLVQCLGLSGACRRAYEPKPKFTSCSRGRYLLMSIPEVEKSHYSLFCRHPESSGGPPSSFWLSLCRRSTTRYYVGSFLGISPSRRIGRKLFMIPMNDMRVSSRERLKAKTRTKACVDFSRSLVLTSHTRKYNSVWNSFKKKFTGISS